MMEMLSVGPSSTSGQYFTVDTGQINNNCKHLDTKHYLYESDDDPTTPRNSILKHPHSSQLPPTPESTPSRGTKHSFATDPEVHPATPSRKRGRLTAFRTPNSPRTRKYRYRNKLTPYFSILYEPEIETPSTVSGIEFKRAAESVLSQVHWDEVADDVASNRYGSFYHKLIRTILQEKLDQIYQEESRLEDEETEEAKLDDGSKDQVQDFGA